MARVVSHSRPVYEEPYGLPPVDHRLSARERTGLLLVLAFGAACAVFAVTGLILRSGPLGLAALASFALLCAAGYLGVWKPGAGR